MSDKKLTVAELLARAGKDGSSEDKPRRRRRRSLEDGGISVAELTGSIPTVEVKPAESRHSSVPIDSPSKAKPEPQKTALDQDAVEVKPEPKPVSAAKPEHEAKTASTPKLAPDTTAPAKTKTGAAPTPKEKAEQPKRPSPGADETVTFDKVESDRHEAKVATKSTETGVIPAIPAVAPKQPAGRASSAVATASAAMEKDDADGAPDTDTQDADSDSSEETTSVTGVILLAIIGVVLGVVVFKGFELLWESLSRPIVAVLAIVVTVAIVGVVKLLRTNNDGLSMFLAGVVGAVMTFGPLIIIML